MSNELPDSHPNNGHPQPQGRTKPLAARQQRFVEEYLLDLNGSQAAIRAGYSEQTATMQASRMLTSRVPSRRHKRRWHSGLIVTSSG